MAAMVAPRMSKSGAAPCWRKSSRAKQRWRQIDLFTGLVMRFVNESFSIA
jgi:hypothetical protein